MLTLAIQYLVDTAGGGVGPEVIVPFQPSTTLLFDGVTFTVPKRGESSICWSFRARVPGSTAPSS